MRNPFDPTVLLARYLHPRVCGQEHDFEVTDCLRVGPAMSDWHAELSAAGLAAIPVEALGYLERAFDELVDGDARPETVSAAPPFVAELYDAQVRIRMALRDGSVEYTDPAPRWHAEILLGMLNFDHGPEVASARIEAEPPWIAPLLESLREQ
jgi:hypothetical protein